MWNLIKILWKIILNIIIIIIALTILNIGISDFETIVIALLLLIYLSINSFSISYGLITIESAQKSQLRFIHLAKLLKDPEVKEFEEISEEEKDELNQSKIGGYINLIFSSIIFIIIIWQILSVLSIL